MSAPARKKATYQDVLDAPPTKVAEVVAGVLYTSPRPASLHANTTSALNFHIGGPFHRDPAGPGGWWILFEPELHLGEDVLVPDLAGWRRDRMDRIEDVAYFTLAPDWVCEVLSPSTEQLDRKGKLEAYARAGVAHVWLVDPRARTLEVLRREEDAKWKLLAVHAEDERPRAAPFDAVELPLAALWLPAST
jgi:Uma2 family endonuclease